MEIETPIITFYYDENFRHQNTITKLILRIESILNFYTLDHKISNDLDEIDLSIELNYPVIKILNHNLFMPIIDNFYMIYEFSRSLMKLKMISKFYGWPSHRSLRILSHNERIIGYIDTTYGIDLVEIKDKLIKLGEIKYHVIGQQYRILPGGTLIIIYNDFEIFVYDLAPIISGESNVPILVQRLEIVGLLSFIQIVSDYQFSLINLQTDNSYNQYIYNFKNIENIFIESTVRLNKNINHKIKILRKNEFDMIVFSSFNEIHYQPDDFINAISMNPLKLMGKISTHCNYLVPSTHSIKIFKINLLKIIINILYYGLFGIIFDYMHLPSIVLETPYGNLLLIE